MRTKKEIKEKLAELKRNDGPMDQKKILLWVLGELFIDDKQSKSKLYD